MLHQNNSTVFTNKMKTFLKITYGMRNLCISSTDSNDSNFPNLFELTLMDYSKSSHSVQVGPKFFSKLHYMKPLKKLHYVNLDSHSVDFISEDSH